MKVSMIQITSVNIVYYHIAGNVGGHYIWWSLYLVVIIFGSIDRNCFLKVDRLKLDGT